MEFFAFSFRFVPVFSQQHADDATPRLICFNDEKTADSRGRVRENIIRRLRYYYANGMDKKKKKIQV